MSVRNGRLLDDALSACPTIAILRGVTPLDVIGAGHALYEGGIRVMEVPLTSPDAAASIHALRGTFGADVVIGAGTVLTVQEIAEVKAAGAQFCVSPNCNASVIREALSAGLVPIPGVATATEAFAAIEAGALLLKLFPSNALGVETLTALMAVTPPGVRYFAVGGVTASSVSDFVRAGCAGFGIGSELYKPGRVPADILKRARAFTDAVSAALNGRYLEAPDPLTVPTVRRVAETSTLVGESPSWNSRDGEIRWVDFGANTMLRCKPSSGHVASTKLDTTLSALFESPAGRLLGVAADTIREVNATTGATTPYATVELADRDCRLNDAAVDPLGRVWVGSMHYALLAGRGELFVVELSGTVRRLASGFGVCNGLGWSPDYRTLYLVDTLNRTLVAFDCDMEAGTVRRPHIVSDFLHVPGKPDGLCVGPDGGVWVAMWGGSRVVRVEADGHISRELILPTKQVSSCCFNPADGHTIYVTTSRYRLSSAELAAMPWSGSLLAVSIGP